MIRFPHLRESTERDTRTIKPNVTKGIPSVSDSREESSLSYSSESPNGGALRGLCYVVKTEEGELSRKSR